MWDRQAMAVGERGGSLPAAGAQAQAEEEEEELECGICCMPYDRCGRAPRRLGGAHGSWKPSRCRHVICSACVCQLAREGWWEEVTCPYCRAVTSLRERAHFLVAGVRRGSGAGRRRLVLPPIDAELWQRVVRLERLQQEEEAGREGALRQPGAAGDQGGDDDDGPWRPWRALKRLLKGGGRQAHARSRSRSRSRGGRSRSSSTPGRRRPSPVNPYNSEIKDLALMTCYII